MLALLAEAGTAESYACFAIGALIFEDDQGPIIESACSSATDADSILWSDSAEIECARIVSAIEILLRSVRSSHAEFRIIVCRKEDFRIWQRDRRRGFATAYEMLTEEMCRTVGRPRPAPLVTDTHLLGGVGVASVRLVEEVPVDRRDPGGAFRATQRLFSLLVSAVASDTNAAIRPPDVRSPAMQQACSVLAAAIGVEALRNDTWPVRLQEAEGRVRHNIWHFPEGFRDSPGVSSSIVIQL